MAATPGLCIGFVPAGRPAIVVHGGVGSSPEWSDGCRRAVEGAVGPLQEGGDALDAAVRAVVALEDDGRFNAGSGSVFRMDGKTVEMDAAVMDSRGMMGCVAALRGVKNPVRAARAVADTPHVFFAGEGARELAARRGVSEPHVPSAHARERVRRLLEQVRKDDRADWRAPWRSFDVRANWNFSTPYDEVLRGCDTVGAVAVDRAGRFAVANSTGGASPMLCGRVGDSPIPGCGFWAGPAGAVAATGVGEEIIRSLLARTVYDILSLGRSPLEAARAGVAIVPQGIAVGVLAVSAEGLAWCANREMSTACWPAAAEA